LLLLIALSVILMFFGLGMVSVQSDAGIEQRLDPAGGVVLQFIFFYPWLALGLRRRHDRNNSGYDLVAFGLFGLAYSVYGTTVPLHNTISVADVAVSGIMYIWLLLGIYLFIVLFLLRGTAGENRYGPVP